MTIKPIFIMATLGTFCAACSGETPPPPEPGAVERLLARMEAQRDDPARLLPVKAREKVRQAERLVPPLEKVQADRIDPDLALALIV